MVAKELTEEKKPGRAFYLMVGLLLLGNRSAWAQDDACYDPDLHVRNAAPAGLSSGQIAIHADSVDLRETGTSELRGDVRVERDRNVLAAEELRFDSFTRTVSTDADSRFESDSMRVSAQTSRIGLNLGTAEFEQADFVVLRSGAHGHADRISFNQQGQAELNEVWYTTCQVGSQDWALKADRIRLDSERGMGSARNARLDFKGVPLLWLPLFYFPVGDQRQTGFLAPEIGDSETTGADIKAPIYINIASNYDLLLTPRFMGRRGAQIGARLRYLWSHGSGSTEVEYLPRDEALGGIDRNRVDIEYSGGAGASWNWSAEFNRVSDIAYLTDLGGSQTSAASTHLPRNLGLSYRPDNGFHSRLRLSDFQTLTETGNSNDEPYARLPELSLGWRPAYRNGHLRPRIALQAVRFQRDGSVQGWRDDVFAGLDWRYDAPAGFAALGADYRYSYYDLEEPSGPLEEQRRSIPSAVAEAGLRFARPLADGHLQTLEPQLHYLYVPFRNQNALPIFDTGLPDFGFDQLFARNRFVGLDRIADANLVTAALTSNLMQPSTGERPLRLRLGLQWRLETSKVRLPGDAVQDAGSSDWLSELDFRLASGWRGVLGGQLNTDTNRFSQSVAAVRYQPRGNSYVQMAYRFRRAVFEQADATIAWPVSANWRLAARWTYALDAQRTVEALGGVEYSSCCWAARVAWRRYLNGDADEFNSSIYLQLELTGLAKLGEGIDGLLDRDILSP